MAESVVSGDGLPSATAEVAHERHLTEEELVRNFLANPWSEDLEDIPGIGPANKYCLNAQGVLTPYQIAAFALSLKGIGISNSEMWEKVYFQLAIWKIYAKRKLIVSSVLLKLDAGFPGAFACDETDFLKFKCSS